MLQLFLDVLELGLWSCALWWWLDWVHWFEWFDINQFDSNIRAAFLVKYFIEIWLFCIH
jgi:hypothetical protein